ncbi:hypothetical protein L6164_004038 [Bauhinia variegata]|uniref:Uncharacterized protein n=1 Tax=Bauhinia variegata TaxID=167791 RepID=A0ACB9Q3W3_BAUVA|nr:hypothetical protein L6164_004038 [Bauhinia variegata]
MESETRRKIEETVTDILKNSNIEEVTEFMVRVAASERLGIDLSDSEHKQFVRKVVESYLLALAEEDENQRENPSELNVPEDGREVMQEVQEVKLKRELKDDTDRIICQLSNKRNVVIQDFKGKTMVSIREYYQKDGKQLPGVKGISLPAEQWSVLKKNVPAIVEAIKKMEAKMSSEFNGKQNEEVPNSVVDTFSTELVPVDISRFNGKNYHLWAQQIGLLLKQLKIAYVLTEPCPSARPGQDSSAEEKRWVDDDSHCRRNILLYLSDHLFDQYAKRKMSARELWEDLKLTYLYEEFGTKRSQVRKYIEYQMVEENSILEQVQEFNNIADSIVASGILVDENFHVSVIISKLPPSWKNICNKLMREEHLPFWKLMERLRTEEASRNQSKKVGEPSNNPGFHLSKRPRGTDNMPSGMHRNKSDMNSKKIPCYYCGKKGHLPKNCWWKSDKQGEERREEENGSISEVDMHRAME